MFHWGAFLIYAVATAVTPGPNNLMSLSQGSRLGFRRALPFNLGIWLGFTVVMLVCTAFCGLLSSLIPRIKGPMLLVGAGYMLWLAWETFQDDASWSGADHDGGGFLKGALLQFVNPKIYLYCMISMEAYILPFYAKNPPALFLFALLLASIGFCFTLCWSAFGSLFQRVFLRYGKLVNTVMALLLVWCAVSLFL